MRKQILPTASALTVALIFGFSFLFTKETLHYFSPFQLLGLRFIIAALGVTTLVAFGLVKLNIRLSDLPGLLKISIWMPVLYFVCETYGVKLTSASESGVVIALVPVAVTVLSVFILKEKISLGQGFSIGLAVAGVMLMALSSPTNGAGKANLHMLGIILLFGAVLAAGFYNIFSRRASVDYSPLDITFVMMWVGALVFNTAGLIQSYMDGQLNNYLTSMGHLPALAGLLYLGLLSSVVGFFLLNFSLSRMTASRTAVFLNLIPVVSVFAGVIFYGERLGLWQVAGGALILMGVWGTNYLANQADNLTGVAENTTGCEG